MRSKRPWKKWARIIRVETNGGDVQFHTHSVDSDNQKRLPQGMKVRGYTMFLMGKHESLTEAEQQLDQWFASWWPKQQKSARRA